MYLVFMLCHLLSSLCNCTAVPTSRHHPCPRNAFSTLHLLIVVLIMLSPSPKSTHIVSTRWAKSALALTCNVLGRGQSHFSLQLQPMLAIGKPIRRSSLRGKFATYIEVRDSSSGWNCLLLAKMCQSIVTLAGESLLKTYIRMQNKEKQMINHVPERTHQGIRSNGMFMLVTTGLLGMHVHGRGNCCQKKVVMGLIIEWFNDLGILGWKCCSIRNSQLEER